jgi:hypothetical protein
MKEGTLLHRKGITRDIYGKSIEDNLGRIATRVRRLPRFEIDTINNKFKKNEDSK